MCIHGGIASLHIVQRARSTRPDGHRQASHRRRLLGELPLLLSPDISACGWPTSMHRRALAKSTKETHMIAAVPVPVDERVSISRLRVDLTSRRGNARSWLVDSAAAIHPGTPPAVCRLHG
jgi:hypothetical protein